ncbi:MAG TPA: M48 family metallopeptidase [Acidobacteriaceae bacterium]|nr:M48 family metallopeptidase [Acidobacteriaceae bacterium]
MAGIVIAAAKGGFCPLPPDKLAQAVALSHWRTWLYFGGTAWMAVALWALVRMGLGGAVARLTARVSARAWVQGLVAAPVWLAVVALLQLPESLLGHHAGLAYGLSVEGWLPWWGDWAKSLGLTVAVGTFVLGVLYALLRHSPGRWWIWFWAFTVPVVVVGTFAAPVIVDPLFNHFTQLDKRDPALVDQLERVAARGGLAIPRDRIFLMDASRKVTTPNAYVTGIGASKRIVVWDTTIQEESPSEILFTYGHEQGHYVLHHIPKGLAFAAGMFLIFYWIAFYALQGLVRWRGVAWGIDGVARWSSLGLVLLLMTVLSFLADPMANAFSRMIEHQADVYGQEVIHGLVPDVQATVEHSFCSDAALWLDDPAPNAFVEFWTYSHPSTEERAEFAARYDPWAAGRSPRYFRK